MKILIAPDKYKGALSARAVAENLGAGIQEGCPEAELDIIPMADGGEGTAEVICDGRGGAWLTGKAHDALGREIKARYCWIEAEKLAVMEMSEAAGLWRLGPNERDVESATTFGVGEMILRATSRGARNIILGLGGSATNDGGFGMARALGFRFFADQREITGGVTELQNLSNIQRPPLRTSPSEGGADEDSRVPSIIAAADVKNPLLGENGATRVFGPQKGVAPDQIEAFEGALTRLADVVKQQFGFDYRDQPAAGAAGGLGFGLMSFCGAKVRSGFDLVADMIGLEQKIKAADLIITGEGSLDRQTLSGKTAAGVARLARQSGKRVVAVVGRSAGDREATELFDEVHVVSNPQIPEQENIARAAELLRLAGHKLAKAFNVSAV